MPSKMMTICEALKTSLAGVTVPVPEANKAKRQKPQLSAKQEAAVREYYAADIALFASITQPATIATK